MATTTMPSAVPLCTVGQQDHCGMKDDPLGSSVIVSANSISNSASSSSSAVSSSSSSISSLFERVSHFRRSLIKTQNKKNKMRPSSGTFNFFHHNNNNTNSTKSLAQPPSSSSSFNNGLDKSSKPVTLHNNNNNIDHHHHHQICDLISSTTTSAVPVAVVTSPSEIVAKAAIVVDEEDAIYGFTSLNLNKPVRSRQLKKTSTCSSSTASSSSSSCSTTSSSQYFSQSSSTGSQIFPSSSCISLYETIDELETTTTTDQPINSPPLPPHNNHQQSSQRTSIFQKLGKPTSGRSVSKVYHQAKNQETDWRKTRRSSAIIFSTEALGYSDSFDSDSIRTQPTTGYGTYYPNHYPHQHQISSNTTYRPAVLMHRSSDDLLMMNSNSNSSHRKFSTDPIRTTRIYENVLHTKSQHHLASISSCDNRKLTKDSGYESASTLINHNGCVTPTNQAPLNYSMSSVEHSRSDSMDSNSSLTERACVPVNLSHLNHQSFENTLPVEDSPPPTPPVRYSSLPEHRAPPHHAPSSSPPRPPPTQHFHVKQDSWPSYVSTTGSTSSSSSSSSSSASLKTGRLVKSNGNSPHSTTPTSQMMMMTQSVSLSSLVVGGSGSGSMANGARHSIATYSSGQIVRSQRVMAPKRQEPCGPPAAPIKMVLVSSPDELGLPPPPPPPLPPKNHPNGDNTYGTNTTITSKNGIQEIKEFQKRAVYEFYLRQKEKQQQQQKQKVNSGDQQPEVKGPKVPPKPVVVSKLNGASRAVESSQSLPPPPSPIATEVTSAKETKLLCSNLDEDLPLPTPPPPPLPTTSPPEVGNRFTFPISEALPPPPEFPPPPTSLEVANGVKPPVESDFPPPPTPQEPYFPAPHDHPNLAITNRLYLEIFKLWPSVDWSKLYPVLVLVLSETVDEEEESPSSPPINGEEMEPELVRIDETRKLNQRLLSRQKLLQMEQTRIECDGEKNEELGRFVLSELARLEPSGSDRNKLELLGTDLTRIVGLIISLEQQLYGCSDDDDEKYRRLTGQLEDAKKLRDGITTRRTLLERRVERKYNSNSNRSDSNSNRSSEHSNNHLLASSLRDYLTRREALLLQQKVIEMIANDLTNG